MKIYPFSPTLILGVIVIFWNCMSFPFQGTPPYKNTSFDSSDSGIAGELPPRLEALGRTSKQSSLSRGKSNKCTCLQLSTLSPFKRGALFALASILCCPNCSCPTFALLHGKGTLAMQPKIYTHSELLIHTCLHSCHDYIIF